MRNGSGVYSKPAGTTASPNTTIESSKFNAVIDDLVADANAARPITAGGTGATSAAAARAGLEIDKKVAYAAKTGDYTAVEEDNNTVLVFSAAATLSLTAVATLGANWHITVKASGGTVTIDPNSTETIDGKATFVIPQGGTVEIISTGTGFVTMANVGAVAFKAHRNGDSGIINPSTSTKLSFFFTDFNVGGFYNTSTSQFVPPAGHYILTAICYYSAGLVAGEDYQIFIYKNGSTVIANTINRAVNTSGQSISATAVVDANGTDYFEVYVSAGQGGSKTISGDKTVTYLSGGSLK